MRFAQILAAVGLVAPIGVAVAAPAKEDLTDFYENFHAKRENLCSLKSPPVLCTPNKSVTVEETAVRAYKFYRAFIVDGDPRSMFSYIDNVYKVGPSQTVLLEGMCSIGANNWAKYTATQSRLSERPAGHLGLVLRGQEDRHRAGHPVVLRRQHQHVVCQVLDRRQVGVG